MLYGVVSFPEGAILPNPQCSSPVRASSSLPSVVFGLAHRQGPALPRCAMGVRDRGLGAFGEGSASFRGALCLGVSLLRGRIGGLRKRVCPGWRGKATRINLLKRHRLPAASKRDPGLSSITYNAWPCVRREGMWWYRFSRRLRDGRGWIRSGEWPIRMCSGQRPDLASRCPAATRRD